MSDDGRISTLLISHIAQFRDGPWDPAVRYRTELCLLDSLACYSAGRSLKHYAVIAAVARRSFGAGVPSAFAMAYLYGEAANLLDFDDTLFFGHPGAAIIGANLAGGAREGLPTDRLLRGIAAGYEAQFLLSTSAAATPERTALVRSVGVWDASAAAIGMCVARGFDDAFIERAIGAAVCHSVLPYTAKWYERPVPSLKNNLGWAGAGAVLATDLASAGKCGVTNPLEGPSAMWRMAGSDRFSLDPALFEKAVVLRTGFKAFPVCWHLQQYLKTMSGLFCSVEQGDQVVQILLSGPQDVERFCEREIVSPTDIAFSLPAAFSLVIAGVEPGPEWAAYGEGDEKLRFRDIFRFALSDDRSIELRTKRGSTLRSPVEAANMHDLATGGLGDDEVLAKHERLTDPALRAGAATALRRGASGEGGDPAQLYEVLSSIMAKQLLELG